MPLCSELYPSAQRLMSEQMPSHSYLLQLELSYGQVFMISAYSGWLLSALVHNDHCDNPITVTIQSPRSRTPDTHLLFLELSMIQLHEFQIHEIYAPCCLVWSSLCPRYVKDIRGLNFKFLRHPPAGPCLRLKLQATMSLGASVPPKVVRSVFLAAAKPLNKE